MRLDKYLKISRLIKRRTVANEACDAGRVLVNDRPTKASAQVKAVIPLRFSLAETRRYGSRFWTSRTLSARKMQKIFINISDTEK